MIVVGPVTAMEKIADRIGGQPSTLIRFGSIAKGSVTDWVGIEPPQGGDDLYINLVAPEPDGREPSLEWGYVREGKWSWMPDGATSCFNHTDLVAVRD